MKDPAPIEIDDVQVEQLIRKAEQGTLDAAEQKRLVPLLKTLLWIERTLLQTRISLAKLKRILFGKKTEKGARKPNAPQRADEGGGVSDEPPGQAGASHAHQRRGHGRRAAADYPGAATVCCPHEQYQSGDHCPLCKRGRLYPLPALVQLRFKGQPLGLATRYERERLRCGGCGAVFVAHLPPEAGQETYATSLKVNLALAHYHPGLPFKRIESFQDLVGMALPDATQWQLVEQVADSAYPVYECLKPLGAQQPVVYQDDTGARILSLMQENQADPPPERKGMYTTVLRFEGEHAICMYVTGRRHAGENLDAILAHRDPKLGPIHWMSDALAANTPKQHQERALDLSCLVHGRRKFVEIDAFFPSECARVLEAIATVYQHEAHCKQHRLTAEQRLAYHQAHSRAVIDDLKTWMEKQLQDKQVEPNSRLGGAFEYLLKRWDALTRFLDIPGAPLDNNTAERALKMILRYRKNSLFYKNEHGAYVGDVLTSLIETCRLAGANPLEYLSALMENRSAVFADAAAWLPWNYRDTLNTEKAMPQLGHPPPVFAQLDRLGIAVPQ